MYEKDWTRIVSGDYAVRLTREINEQPNPLEIKPNIMNDNEMGNFFNLRIIPVFKKLNKQLSEFNFENIDFNSYRRVATFKVSEVLSLFHFKVDIDNGSRQIRVFCEIRYRNAKKKKLLQIYDTESLNISFRNIDTINDEMLISLFTKWYMNKDEAIQKDKEMAEKRINN